MNIDIEKLKKTIELHAIPRWQGEIKDDWTLRPGGGETYVQTDVLGRYENYLTRESLEQDPKAGLLNGLRIHRNLLSQFEGSYAKKFVEEHDEDDLRDHIIHFIYGENSLKDRFSGFTDWAKVKKIEGSTWKIGINSVVAGYLLSLVDPLKYPYCKPTAYNRAVRELLGESEVKQDHAERYVQCQNLYSRILDILTNEYGLKNGNLYDVHTLMYMFNDLGWHKGDISQGTEVKPVTKESSMIERNLILYGPPGTGKTYHTANLAVQICDSKVPDTRPELMLRYKELVAEQRISFVSFHQSYSYEEFIEGIRPDMVKGEETDEEKLVYKVEDGLFKKVCRMATDAVSVKKRPGGFLDSLKGRKFYKMSVGGKLDPEVEDFCLHNNYLALGWGGDVDFSKIPKEKNWDFAKKAIKDLMEREQSEYAVKKFAVQAMYWFKNAMNIGDIVIISRGLNEIQAIGVVEGEYEYKPELLPGMGYEHFRKVRWLITDDAIPVEKIQNKIFSQMTIYSLNENALNMEYLTDLLCRQGDAVEKGESERYVLIIDEINRGNISKILGELITLLEPDKRLGGENEIKVTLPYSRKEFAVPSNLYIIATMNTADRSIAFMDTALRRRFHFREIMPDISKVKENVGEEGVLEDVDISELLETLNNRIELLYDRDHQLGHSYFMKVKSLTELRITLLDKIVPLLQEYFYEDWEKLCAVLGCPYDPETGKPTSGKTYKCPIITVEILDANIIPGYDHDDYENRLRYKINQSFIKAKDNELADYFNAIINPKQIENTVDEEATQ